MALFPSTSKRMRATRMTTPLTGKPGSLCAGSWGTPTSFTWPTPNSVSKPLSSASQKNKAALLRGCRGPKPEPAIRRAAENLLARYKVKDWVEFQIDLTPNDGSLRSTPRQHSSIPVLSVRENAAAISRAQAMDGVFPLVTNTDLP